MHPVVDEAQLTRLFKVVAQLKQQANLTDKINAQNKAHTIIENNTLFSPSLFSTDSDCFSSYTDELEIKVKSLSRLIKAKRLALSALALTKIEQQIQALLTALNANKTIDKAYQLKNIIIKEVPKIRYVFPFEKLLSAFVIFDFPSF